MDIEFLLRPIALWGVTLAACAGLVAVYAVQFRRAARRDYARRKEAERLKIHRPTAQYPLIDADRCIGCGTCVAVCPEGDVLGVVMGVATVINGLRCVGHGECAAHCPVGAIVIGMGDVPRPDVPRLDEAGRTTVPGVYVAGELSGQALIRVAFQQARTVVDAVVEDGRTSIPGSADVLDLLIVGSGPAGLAAGLRARVQGLSFRLLEQESDLGGTILHYPRRKMVLTAEVALPQGGRLDRREYRKEELLEIFQRLADEAALPIEFGLRVVGVERRGDLFRVVGRRGDREESWTCRALVLALGRRGSPRRLGVPGEDLEKVLYRLVDARSYSDQDILVVGGGDSAVEAAVTLAEANRVTLSYRRDRLVRVKQKNQKAFDEVCRRGKLVAAFSTEVREIEPDRVRLSTPEGDRWIDNDVVFVMIGGEPPLGLLRRLGVALGAEASQPVAAR